MVIVYAVAAAAAALAAFGATRDPNIPFWRRDRVALSFALGWIYLLYALTGAFVAVLAEHAGWHLISDRDGGEWINGLAYGLAALLILRVDVIPYVVITVAPAKLLVDLFLGRFTQRLDDAAASAIERRVGDLSLDELIKLSYRLYRKYVASLVETGQLKPRVAKNHKRCLFRVHRQVGNAEPVPDSDMAAQTVAAIEYLRDYVSERLIEERDGKTHIG